MYIKYSGKPAMMLIVALLLSFGGLTAASANNQQCKTDIKALIKSYEKALNSSNVAKVMRLYAKDGVFMPSSKPTSQGYDQVRTAYKYVFRDLDLDVSFHIDEIVWRDDIAFVRTVSDGEIKLLKKDITLKNNSRELFVMKRINDDWKIYRYMFNEMSSPKH